MPVRVAINGFGRIGRLVFRAAMYREDLVVVAVNDLADAQTNAHLLKYDSTHGRLNAEVQAREGAMIVEGREVKTFLERNPQNLPWRDLGVEVVVEATGYFTEAGRAQAHLQAGAKRVVITAPAKNEDATLVVGVNHHAYDPARHRIISSASCTTNCLAPVAKVLYQRFGLRRGLMATVHAFTNDQRLLDMEHRDLRRARSATVSIVPTTTGAARAIGTVLPELAGKLNGFAVRVPVTDVSLLDLVAEVDRPATAEELNSAFREAAEGELAGVLAYTEEPLVSIDLKGDPHSAVVDGLSTMVMEDTLVKVVAWYDNEWGYSCRVVDLIGFMASRGI
ncbi:MAG: type I glyceraldehyde-3-phosphate dehydrogenase [Moorellales bacterium]